MADRRPRSGRRRLLTAIAVGLLVGVGFMLWRGDVVDNPLAPETLSPRHVGPNDCVDVREKVEPVLEIVRTTTCTDPHEAEVLTSGTVNGSAASYARSLGIIDWCRESASLQLSGLETQGVGTAYRVGVASDGADPERPQGGDTVACLVLREDGSELSEPIP